MDLLGPPHTTKRGHRHVLSITDRYSKLSAVVSMDKIQAPQCAEDFMDSFSIPYGLPNFVLAN